MNRRLRFAAGAMIMAAFAGCSTYGSITRDRNLYYQLGGKAGIKKIVGNLLDIALTDGRILEVFADKDIPHIKESVTDQICSLTGGPCAYHGKTMEEIHKGLRINGGEFNAFVEDLQKAMNDQHVPLGAQNKLLAILAPMRRDILNK